MIQPFNAGQVDEALEAADNAVFNALNTATNHRPCEVENEDYGLLVVELAHVSNVLRAMTNQTPLALNSELEITFPGENGEPTQAGAAWKRIRDKAFSLAHRTSRETEAADVVAAEEEYDDEEVR